MSVLLLLLLLLLSGIIPLPLAALLFFTLFLGFGAWMALLTGF